MPALSVSQVRVPVPCHMPQLSSAIFRAEILQAMRAGRGVFSRYAARLFVECVPAEDHGFAENHRVVSVGGDAVGQGGAGAGSGGDLFGVE